MSKSKSTLAVFAALVALGATLDAQARGHGGGMGGGQMGGQGSGQMGGQGKGQYGGQGMGHQQNAQGSGEMTRERIRTREMSQNGTPDMQQDMAQRRAMRQENRQVQQFSADGETAAQ